MCKVQACIVVCLELWIGSRRLAWFESYDQQTRVQSQAQSRSGPLFAQVRTLAVVELTLQHRSSVPEAQAGSHDGPAVLPGTKVQGLTQASNCRPIGQVRDNCFLQLVAHAANPAQTTCILGEMYNDQKVPWQLVAQACVFIAGARLLV